MKQFHKAKIKDGKFISNKRAFINACSSLPDGSYIHLLIKVSDRTERENQNYYFVQLGEWEDNGYTKLELHDLIKHELFVELFGEPISSSDLTNEQWTLVFFNLSTFLISKFENV